MISSKGEFKFIISARDDYIINEGQEECWLFNINWKVKPSIANQEGKVPDVLT